MQNRVRVMAVLATAAISCRLFAAEPTADKVMAATGIKNGLLVHLGATDGSLGIELASGGKILVHDLVTDTASLSAIRAGATARRLYGMVSVDRKASLAHLPYADNLVNVVVADLGQLAPAGLTQEEINRVLAPEGKAYIKDGGGWNTVVKPRPAGMDVWTHRYHGPDMNPVSADSMVAPSTGVQWLGWYGEFENNIEGLHGHPTQNVVITKTRLVRGLQYMPDWQCAYISARDPYNGVATWLTKTESSLGSDNLPMTAGTENVYIAGDSWGKGPTAYDLASGTVVKHFDGIKGHSEFEITLNLANGLLLYTSKDSLVAMDSATGARKWVYTEETEPFGTHGSRHSSDTVNKRIYYPVVSTATNRVYFCVGQPGTIVDGGRHPSAFAEALVCLNLSTGATIWKTKYKDVLPQNYNAKSPTQNFMTFLVVKGNYVISAASWVANYDNPWPLAVFDATDGHLVWTKQMNPSYYDTTKSAYVATNLDYQQCLHWGPLGCAAYNNRVYISTKESFSAFNIATGAPEVLFNPPVPNNRCVTPAITPNWHIVGFSVWSNPQQQWTYKNIARSTCAASGIPANGLMYYGPNGECGCFAMLRTEAALSSSPLPPDAEDATRLEKGNAAPPASALSASAWSADTAPELRANLLHPPSFKIQPIQCNGNANPIQSDWSNTDQMPNPETDTLKADGKKFVGVVNEHRVECRDADNSVAWSFTAGGRITHSPVVANGLVFFGCHDGYAYCLREDNGALVWRFLGARADRRIVAFSQVESASPLYNCVFVGNKVCFAAGRHPEVDGGIYSWAIDPITGAIAWKNITSTNNPMVAPDSKAYAGYVNKDLNYTLKAAGSTLEMGSLKLNVNGSGVRAKGAGKKTAAWEPAVKPVHGWIKVDLGKPYARADLEIMDMTGRLLVTHTLYGQSGGAIPLSLLRSGKYGYRLTADGSVTHGSFYLVAR